MEVRLEVPEDVLVAAKIRGKYAASELTKELAVHLFEREMLSFGKASRLARMPKWEFMSLLASQRVPLHYTEDDFEDDLVTLKRLNKDKD